MQHGISSEQSHAVLVRDKSSRRLGMSLSSIQRSHSLLTIEGGDIGLQLDITDLSPFLKTGTTLDLFHSSGSLPNRSDKLNRAHRDGASSDWTHSFRISG